MKRLFIPLLLLVLLLLQGCQNIDTPSVDTVSLPQASAPDVILSNPDPGEAGDNQTYSSERFTVDFTALSDVFFAQAEEIIYEDEYFIYSLPRISSEYYFIVFADGTRMPLVEALTTGQVSVDDCIAYGLPADRRFRQQDNTVYLNVPENRYSLQEEFIPYTIVNNSGEQINVSIIPLLERLDGETWIAISTVGVMFCGVADPIDAQLDGELPLSWYEGSLTTGHYRLSFRVGDIENNVAVTLLSDTFEMS